jgi:hypothetical protein
MAGGESLRIFLLRCYNSGGLSGNAVDYLLLEKLL